MRRRAIRSIVASTQAVSNVASGASGCGARHGVDESLGSWGTFERALGVHRKLQLIFEFGSIELIRSSGHEVTTLHRLL